MPQVSAEFIDRAHEIEEKYDDLRASVRVATDDLRQLAATLHTEDHDSIYDALIDIARALERDAGIYRREAE
ncbi:hypothetical protein [Brevibacillus borstelensis]|uniref:hypothetical protein n=1 Tax=Brevibacillus borstelensis TaxID=45462 RepID=UPI00287F41CB|nr:hypothetical protein [Brevibacillus borstelensis]WNF07448.1 hypothetical protein RFB14_08585 [Brevibacillus borstelensis]